MTVLGAIFIEQKGAACCCARGAGERPVVTPREQGSGLLSGEFFKQGAWGFKFWEQHAVIGLGL